MGHHDLEANDLVVGAVPEAIAALSGILHQRKLRSANPAVRAAAAAVEAAREAVAPVKAKQAKQRNHKPRIARESAGPDEWLRLDDARRLAFRDGGMTLSGLRNEISKGNLRASKIAGKIFTTLNAIDQMMRGEPCSNGAGEEAKARDYISGKPSEPAKGTDGSSSTQITGSGSSEALAHLQVIAQELKKPSPRTSRRNTNRISAKVIPLRS